MVRNWSIQDVKASSLADKIDSVYSHSATEVEARKTKASKLIPQAKLKKLKPVYHHLESCRHNEHASSADKFSPQAVIQKTPRKTELAAVIAKNVDSCINITFERTRNQQDYGNGEVCNICGLRPSEAGSRPPNHLHKFMVPKQRQKLTQFCRTGCLPSNAPQSCRYFHCPRFVGPLRGYAPARTLHSDRTASISHDRNKFSPVTSCCKPVGEEALHGRNNEKLDTSRTLTYPNQTCSDQNAWRFHSDQLQRSRKHKFYLVDKETAVYCPSLVPTDLRARVDENCFFNTAKLDQLNRNKLATETEEKFGKKPADEPEGWKFSTENKVKKPMEIFVKQKPSVEMPDANVLPAGFSAVTKSSIGKHQNTSRTDSTPLSLKLFPEISGKKLSKLSNSNLSNANFDNAFAQIKPKETVESEGQKLRELPNLDTALKGINDPPMNTEVTEDSVTSEDEEIEQIFKNGEKDFVLGDEVKIQLEDQVTVQLQLKFATQEKSCFAMEDTLLITGKLTFAKEENEFTEKENLSNTENRREEGGLCTIVEELSHKLQTPCPGYRKPTDSFLRGSITSEEIQRRKAGRTSPRYLMMANTRKRVPSELSTRKTLVKPCQYPNRSAFTTFSRKVRPEHCSNNKRATYLPSRSVSYGIPVQTKIGSNGAKFKDLKCYTVPCAKAAHSDRSRIASSSKSNLCSSRVETIGCGARDRLHLSGKIGATSECEQLGFSLREFVMLNSSYNRLFDELSSNKERSPAEPVCESEPSVARWSVFDHAKRLLNSWLKGPTKVSASCSNTHMIPTTSKDVNKMGFLSGCDYKPIESSI